MNNSSLIQLLRDGIDCADVLGMDWSHVRDTVVRTTIVYTYLQQLTAAHAAELAEKDAEINRLREAIAALSAKPEPAKPAEQSILLSSGATMKPAIAADKETP